MDDTVHRPLTFSDCAKVFRECKDAEKYENQNDDEEPEKPKENEAVTDSSQENLAENKNLENELDQHAEGGGDSSTEDAQSETIDSNAVRRKRSNNRLTNFILKRMK